MIDDLSTKCMASVDLFHMLGLLIDLKVTISATSVEKGSGHVADVRLRD